MLSSSNLEPTWDTCRSTDPLPQCTLSDQVVTRISAVYDLQLPEEVKQLLKVFNVFNVNLAALGLPLQCLGLGNYEDHLAFTMFAPVVLATAILLCFFLWPFLKAIASLDARWFRRGNPKEMLFAALPWQLLLSFLTFPMVSSSAFLAFSCEDFDNGRSFLRADFAIECYTEDYAGVEQLAWLGIFLFPVGISVLYAVLLVASRRAVIDEKPTSLSKALGFLVRDFEPTFMWWELLMLWRQLFLVGFAVLVMPGTIEQLMIAFLVTLGYMLLFAVAAPYKNDSDDYFAKACSFALTAVFFFAVVIKFGVLTDAMDVMLSKQLRHTFQFDVYLVTVGMCCSILVALLLAAAMAGQQIVDAARLPTIRLQRTKAVPDLELALGHLWHMFLSHIWGTGQDQCATIKRQLTIILPNPSIFLDVDNLQSIDALEEYIAQSALIMIFVSKGYFLSKNCLREVDAAVGQKKPLCLVIDPVRGGAPLADLKAECRAELQTAIFGPPGMPRDIIVWHRIKDFQLVSLKLLAEKLILSCPNNLGKPSIGIFIPGEVTRAKLAFFAPVRLYTSRNNPGASAVATRLRDGMVGLSVTDRRPRQLLDEDTGAVAVTGQLGQLLTAGGNIFGTGAVDDLEPTHMLLYLNDSTFVGEEGKALAAELRAARAANFPVLMLHENDETVGGCEFSRFFETTPQDLIVDGLYSALAVALYPGPFWPVSVVLVAQNDPLTLSAPGPTAAPAPASTSPS